MVEQNITGINKLRTAQKARVRSMPRQKGQEYLDIYLAQRLTTRLERERENVEARRERIDGEYAELSADVRRLQAEIGTGGEASPGAAQEGAAGKRKQNMPRRVKKMEMQY